MTEESYIVAAVNSHVSRPRLQCHWLMYYQHWSGLNDLHVVGHSWSLVICSVKSTTSRSSEIGAVSYTHLTLPTNREV